MDEKDLQIFLELASTKNLTHTAEKLYLAQPTLSKRLQNMEVELGGPLFLRSKQGLSLTPAGEMAKETFQKIAGELDDLRDRIQQSQGVVGGTLRVEASIDYSTFRLPKILAAYTAQYPNVTLKVTSDHSRDCVRKLQQGQAHLAVVRGDYEWDGRKVLLERESVFLIRGRDKADVPLDQQRYIADSADIQQRHVLGFTAVQQELRVGYQRRAQTPGGHIPDAEIADHRTAKILGQIGRVADLQRTPDSTA